jgi:hypothetical protein
MFFNSFLRDAVTNGTNRRDFLGTLAALEPTSFSASTTHK